MATQYNHVQHSYKNAHTTQMLTVPVQVSILPGSSPDPEYPEFPFSTYWLTAWLVGI